MYRSVKAKCKGDSVIDLAGFFKVSKIFNVVPEPHSVQNPFSMETKDKQMIWPINLDFCSKQKRLILAVYFDRENWNNYCILIVI